MASSDQTTLVTIRANSTKNMVQAGVTFDCDEKAPLIFYTEEEAKEALFAFPFTNEVVNKDGIEEQITKIQCGMTF